MKLIEIVPNASGYTTIVDWLDATILRDGKPIAWFWDAEMAKKFVELWNEQEHNETNTTWKTRGGEEMSKRKKQKKTRQPLVAGKKKK